MRGMARLEGSIRTRADARSGTVALNGPCLVFARDCHYTYLLFRKVLVPVTYDTGAVPTTAVALVWILSPVAVVMRVFRKP